MKLGPRRRGGQTMKPRTAFWCACGIWVLSLGMMITALAYNAVQPLPASQQGSAADGVAGVVFITGFATVGALLVWKRPGNPIGWLLSASGLAYAAADFGLLLYHLPVARAWLAWFGWMWLFGLGLDGVRPAAVPHRAPALPPLAAGGLGGRGRPGRLGPGQRVRSQDHHRRHAHAEPHRRARAGRERLPGPGRRRRAADRRHRPGRHRLGGVPVPAGRDGGARAAEVAGVRGRADRGGLSGRAGGGKDHWARATRPPTWRTR